jgi:hypothetical protein
MSDYLIVGDVDHIQDYVFGSNRLRAIRGASALLGQAAESIECTPPADLDILRWRGGQIVAVLRHASVQSAEQVCAQLERVFRESSAGEATLTTGYAEYDGQNFKGAVADAFKIVRREKDGRHRLGPDGEALLTSPYDRRCDLLSVQSAQMRRLVSQAGEPIEYRFHSPAADKQWQAVRSKIPFDQDLQKELIKAGALDDKDAKDYRFPYAPEDLWRWESDEQYVALVMADGNSFGQMLECIDDTELYQEYSNEIYRLTLNAVARAAKETGIDKTVSFFKRGSKWLPLTPIILAGDDLSLLVRKEHGLGFAHTLCQKFSSLSMDATEYPHVRRVISLFRQCQPLAGMKLFPGDDPRSWRLTLSAGIAIAKRKFPISVLRRLAGELRAEAKRALRHDWDAAVRGNGVLDFAVITTATVQPLQDLRKRYRIDEEPGRPPEYPGKWVCLTERPYTLDRFEQLQRLAHALQRIPRSKRKFLYTELFKGKAAGTEAYRFLMAREPEARRDIKETSRELLPDASKSPFRENRIDTWTTPLVDALELAELLPGGEQ